MTATVDPSSAMTAAAVAAAAVSCPDDIFSTPDQCPSGCVAAREPALLGVAEDAWTCETSTPAVVWVSFEATSTCGVGSAVTTYTLWGGQEREGCKKV
jgi:hypothetical protein